MKYNDEDLDALLELELGKLTREERRAIPPCEDFHCVEHFRKVREMHYYEEEGIPCDDLKAEIRKTLHLVNEHTYAYLQSQKQLKTA